MVECHNCHVVCGEKDCFCPSVRLGLCILTVERDL